jgi:Protein of unknown function (DUF4079)
VLTSVSELPISASLKVASQPLKSSQMDFVGTGSPPALSVAVSGGASLDSLRETLHDYASIYFPFLDAIKDQLGASVSDPLIHWGHGFAMASVLFSMGVVGTIMGWQIRLGQGNVVNALSMGETIRQAHPKIMGGALLFFVIGGHGGFVLKDYLLSGEHDIFDSPHAVTALISLGLMSVQAILPLLFRFAPSSLRTVHAYLGSMTMVALLGHLWTGIQLGTSF